MLKKCSPWCILRECRGMPNHDQQALCTREGHVESSLVGQEADALATRVVGRAHRAEEDHLALASLVRIDGLHVVPASNLLAKSILLRSVRREDPHVSNHVRFLFGGSLLEAGNDHRAHSSRTRWHAGPRTASQRTEVGGRQRERHVWCSPACQGHRGELRRRSGTGGKPRSPVPSYIARRGARLCVLSCAAARRGGAKAAAALPLR